MRKDVSRTPLRILLGFRVVEALRDVLEGVGRFVKERQLPWQIHCVDADEFVSTLQPSTTDGAINVITPDSRKLLAKLSKTGVPIVNMLHEVQPVLPSVLSDERAIGRVAGEYLASKGFSEFAYFGTNKGWSVGRRIGFSAM